MEQSFEGIILVLLATNDAIIQRTDALYPAIQFSGLKTLYIDTGRASQWTGNAVHYDDDSGYTVFDNDLNIDVTINNDLDLSQYVKKDELIELIKEVMNEQSVSTNAKPTNSKQSN